LTGVLFVAVGLWALVGPVAASSGPPKDLGPLTSAERAFYGEVFPEAVHRVAHPIKDPILNADLKEEGKSEDSPNVEFLGLFNKSRELLGYIREVDTTTGCNKYCKPLQFTLALGKEGTFKALLHRDELTKKWHAKFTPQDYFKLESILSDPPKIFKGAEHSTELIDAVSMATHKKFRPHVVSEAALSTFRIYQYLIQTRQAISQIRASKRAVGPSS